MRETRQPVLQPVAPTWRVTNWEITDDGRWKVAGVSDHLEGDWQTALTVARAWFALSIDDIEAHRRRIKIDPVSPG
jgi:hypothetical protein